MSRGEKVTCLSSLPLAPASLQQAAFLARGAHVCARTLTRGRVSGRRENCNYCKSADCHTSRLQAARSRVCVNHLWLTVIIQTCIFTTGDKLHKGEEGEAHVAELYSGLHAHHHMSKVQTSYQRFHQ